MTNDKETSIVLFLFLGYGGIAPIKLNESNNKAKTRSGLLLSSVYESLVLDGLICLPQ